jgi:hypothetical protein
MQKMRKKKMKTNLKKTNFLSLFFLIDHFDVCYTPSIKKSILNRN